MISSVHNPKVQDLRALQTRPKRRRESGAFVVEGVRLAEEALNSGWKARGVFYTEDLDNRGQSVLRSLKTQGTLLEEVSESVMRAISDTQTPQGILLEMEARELPIVEQPSLVLILDGLSDPGNLGTLLRSAAAAAVNAVILGPGSADAFAPKVLRSGMGAHFRLPIREMEWPAISQFIQQQELHVFIAETNEGKAYDEVDLTRNLALIIGGEAHGTSAPAKQLNPEPIHIPMPGQIESLNAATSASLLIFEALRQRRSRAAK